MPEVLDSFETRVSEEEVFNSYVALHSLQRIVANLDTRRREEIQGHLNAIRLPDFEAPEGYVIKLVPDHPTSREVIPSLEQFINEPLEDSVALSPNWQPIIPGSTFYEKHVKLNRWQDEAVFTGTKLHQNNDGMLFVVGGAAANVRAYADQHMKIEIERAGR